MPPYKPYPDWVFKVLTWVIVAAIILYFIKKIFGWSL